MSLGVTKSSVTAEWFSRANTGRKVAPFFVKRYSSRFL